MAKGFTPDPKPMRKPKRKRYDKPRTDAQKAATKRKRQKYLKRIAEKQEQFEADREFYVEIWNERPHVCEETGEALGNEPLIWMFDHVLEKGRPKYAHLRYEKQNIQLLSLVAHARKTNGYITDYQRNKIESTRKHFGL